MITTTMTMNEITFGSRVTTCDSPLPGRVNMVWRVPASTASAADRLYYRVQFPPRSPFVGDWAIYRQGELASTHTATNPPTPAHH